MEKELHRAMRPFRARLAAEGAVRAACMAGLPVLPVCLVLALLRDVPGAARLAAHMPAAWALLFAALYLLRYRPTPQRAAKRLDALCGMDRVSTAVEFCGSEGVLCALQREDAARRLAAVPPGALRLSLPVPALAACLLLLALLLAAARLPASVTQRLAARLPGFSLHQSEEAAALRAMTQALRGEVEAAGLEAEDRDALLARADALLSQLDAGTADLEALRGLRDALEGMRRDVQALTPRDTYMAAMTELESLRALGEAIYAQNMDLVLMILDSMSRSLREKEGMEQVEALLSLSGDVNASLAKPLRDGGQAQLCQGMMAFAGGLETAAEAAYRGRDNARMIDAAFDTAGMYIRQYLGVPEEGERYDPYALREQAAPSKGAARSQRAPEAAEGAQKPLTRAQTECVYDPPDSLRSGGYAPGTPDEGRGGARPAGVRPYGEVYAPYYAAFLARLSGDSLPQELRDAAQAYMNGL